MSSDNVTSMMDKMNDGKRMRLGWEILEPVVRVMQKETHDKLMMAVRNGKVDELMVMRMEVLDDIEKRVNSKIKRGHKAAEKLVEKGEL